MPAPIVVPLFSAEKLVGLSAALAGSAAMTHALQQQQKQREEEAQKQALQERRQQFKARSEAVRHNQPTKEARSQSVSMTNDQTQSKTQDKALGKESSKETGIALVDATSLSKQHSGINSRSESGADVRTKDKACYSDKYFNTYQSLLPSKERLETSARQKVNPSIIGTLHRRGTTLEQEERLMNIYHYEKGRRSSTNIDRTVQDYQRFMHEVAVKNGREVMDRAQDAEAALATDQQAFSYLMERSQSASSNSLGQAHPASITQAIAQASPNTANLTKIEQQQYMALVKAPSYEVVKNLEMFREYQGSRGGRSQEELIAVFQHNHHLSKSKPTEQEKKMFDAEHADLGFRQVPGLNLGAAQEYQRQLGEHIRHVGRDRLANSEQECKQNTISSDQLIAGRMFISGHNRFEVTHAIKANSPAPESRESAARYVQEEIQPVFSRPIVFLIKEEVQELRSNYSVPNDIKRFDCLTKVADDILQQKWNPEEPEKTCSGYELNSRQPQHNYDMDR